MNSPDGTVIEIPADMEPNPYFFTVDSVGKVDSFLMVNKNDLSPVDDYLSQFTDSVFD